MTTKRVSVVVLSERTIDDPLGPGDLALAIAWPGEQPSLDPVFLDHTPTGFIIRRNPGIDVALDLDTETIAAIRQMKTIPIAEFDRDQILKVRYLATIR